MDEIATLNSCMCLNASMHLRGPLDATHSPLYRQSAKWVQNIPVLSKMAYFKHPRLRRVAEQSVKESRIITEKVLL